MEPAFYDGDHVLTFNWIRPKAGDAIVFRKNGKNLIKRVEKIKVVDYLTKNSPEKIVEDQNNESAEVWKGVEAIVKTDYAWGSFIIEGVAILPSLVKKLTAELSYVRSVFLIDEDESRIRDLVFARGLWDDAYKYPDSVKEKEVEWAGAFSKWLVKECEKYSLPVVYIKDRASYIEEVKRLAL